MNNTIALDSHAEATEHRPISPIEHDRVTAAAAAHDALAIGEPLLIVAGGPAAVRADLCRALTVDRLAVGEDVLVLATRTDGAVPEGSVAAYLGLPAEASEDALADALAQYATAETRLVLILTNAERLDEGGVTVIRRLRQADPAARALSVVLLGDDTVGLVGDRLLRPAPPGGLRFIRLTPLALAPAAPVAALPAGPPIAPPLPAPPAAAPPPAVAAPAPPAVTAPPIDAPSVALSPASTAPHAEAPWAADAPTEALAEPTPPPHDHAAYWDATPEPEAYAASEDAVMAHDEGAHDQAVHDHEAHDHAAQDHAAHEHGAHDHAAHDHGSYHQEVYDEEADGAADLALADEPAETYEEPEAERNVPYWELLPERPAAPAPEPVQGPLDQVPATRDWHSFQDTPGPVARTDHASAPAEPDYAPQVVAAAPSPSPPPKEAGRDKDWGTLKAAAQTGRYPPAAEGEAGAYAPADAAAYQDAFAQLAAQEARVVQPPRAAPQPMLRRAQVLAGGDVGAVDEDGVPLEIRGSRTRMILPFAGIAVLAALIGWFVVRAVVGGHSASQGLQIALSTAAPDPLLVKPAPSTPAPSTPTPSTAALSTTAPKDAPPDVPAASDKAAAPGPAGAAPPGAVPPTGSQTAAAVAAPPPQPPAAAHVDPAPPVKPETAPSAAREAATEHGRPQAMAAATPAMSEATGAAAHPPVAPATAGAPPPAHPAPQHPAAEPQAVAPPAPPPAPVPQAAMAAPALPPGPGLLVIAKAEDTLQSLYSRVYKGLQAPPFEVVEAMNPHEIKLGDVVVFPAPPGGWHRLPNTAGR